MRDMGELCPAPEALAGWLEQTLSAPERAKVTAHLASCDDCRRAVTIASSVERPGEGAVNEILLHRVVAASRRRPIAAWITAVAGILAAVIVLWPRSSRHEAPVTAHGPLATPEPAPRHPVPPAADLKKPSPSPGVIVPEKPVPSPVPTPGPVSPQPLKEEPKKVVAESHPEPLPVVPPRETPPPVAKKPREDVVNPPPSLFASVTVLDPSGDLWLNRQGGDPAPVGRFEQVGYKDTLSTHHALGAFALEGKATLALDKNTSATLAYRPADQAYAINVTQGTVMIDTESSRQSWKVSGGRAEFTIANVNGRFVIEPRGESLAAVFLSGRAEVKTPATSKPVDADRGLREVLVGGEGKVSEESARQTRKYAPLAQSRPKEVTVFTATFRDKEKDEALPFAYTLPSGTLKDGVLHADVPPNAYPKSGEKVVASSSVKPEHPIKASSTMVLRFHYRTNVPTFTVLLGRHSTVYTSHVRAMEWGVAEIRLDAFEREGTTLQPGDPVGDIHFQVVADGKKNSILDVDGIQFLKRSR